MNNDLISRQAAIDVIEKHIDILDAIDENYLDGLKIAMSLLKVLPSAQPERKKGEWIYKDIGGWHCSECDEQAPFWCMASTQNLPSFCPNCGADMRGEER